MSEIVVLDDGPDWMAAENLIKDGDLDLEHNKQQAFRSVVTGYSLQLIFINCIIQK